MKIFGLDISRKIKEIDDTPEKEKVSSFAPPVETDGSQVISGNSTSGYYGQTLDLDDASVGNERDAILKYRAAAIQPECDNAISDIINGAIVADNAGTPVNLNTDALDVPDNVKDLIREEFQNVTKLLSFNFSGHDIFRRWYIDGKLYYHLLIDPDNIKKGIQEVRLIDPLKIKKIKEVKTKINPDTGIKTHYVAKEYFLYSDDLGSHTTAIKIDPTSIVYVPSGNLDDNGKFAVSYLHKSVKLVNQLRIMEDALVIYRISRAPERRIFYIDIGNLPKGKAEQYVQGIMSRYRNKLVYDATSGEVKDDRKAMSMLEDFWLPRREGGRGTEISTLPGGENLSQIDDVVFFQKKLYRSLNVPVGRLDVEGSQYGVGRASEISREEVKFQKFINRLRKKFSVLFIDMLKVQCLLKNICTEAEWPEIRESISVDYIEDNFFSELKDFEILGERLNMLDQIQPHIGKYYSDKWVRSNILNMSEEDVERMEAEIADEPEPEEDDLGF